VNKQNCRLIFLMIIHTLDNEKIQHLIVRFVFALLITELYYNKHDLLPCTHHINLIFFIFNILLCINIPDSVGNTNGVECLDGGNFLPKLFPDPVIVHSFFIIIIFIINIINIIFIFIFIFSFLLNSKNFFYFIFLIGGK
jgi:hypothetical protein